MKRTPVQEEAYVIGRVNEWCNIAIKEVQDTGRLRVTVGDAFSDKHELRKLCSLICVLKKYAEGAALGHNEMMDLPTWCKWFAEFDAVLQVTPGGKPQ